MPQLDKVPAPLPEKFLPEQLGSALSWPDLISQNLVVVIIIISYILLIIMYLVFTYDRSFRIHQKTVQRAWDRNESARCFVKSIHVGNDGTTIVFAEKEKEQRHSNSNSDSMEGK